MTYSLWIVNSNINNYFTTSLAFHNKKCLTIQFQQSISYIHRESTFWACRWIFYILLLLFWIPFTHHLCFHSVHYQRFCSLLLTFCLMICMLNWLSRENFQYILFNHVRSISCMLSDIYWQRIIHRKGHFIAGYGNEWLLNMMYLIFFSWLHSILKRIRIDAKLLIICDCSMLNTSIENKQLVYSN